MQDNTAALAQTMSLFDQKHDDSSQSEDGQNNEDDNESYVELGFLKMNVVDGTDGKSNRMGKHQQSAYYARSNYEGLYIDSSDDEKKGDAPLSKYLRNFLPNPVRTTIVMKNREDTFGVDLSMKDSSMMDAILNLKIKSPEDMRNQKSQLKRGHILRNSSSMSLEGYSIYEDENSSTQGMFTPSPDEFDRYGEWSIENDFETRGLKQSFSIMRDEEAKVENALNAKWDKKRVNEKEKIESHRITEVTIWDI